MAFDEKSPKKGGQEVAGVRNGELQPSASPADARRLLGRELRSMREASEMTLNAVAGEVQRSPATMSRLERGESTPRAVEVNALLDLYSRRKPGLVSTERRESVLVLVQESREGNWVTEYRDVMGTGQPAAAFQRYVELETDATEILSYQVELIPGQLQSPGYARAVADLYREGESAALKDRFVQFRLERQRRLGTRRLHLVINEIALRREVGHPDVMVEQLRILGNEIRNGRPNVEIQIAPLSLAIPTATRGPFVLMRMAGSQPDVVYLEDPRFGGDFMTKPDDFARFEAEFAVLTANALGRDEALTLIQKLIGE